MGQWIEPSPVPVATGSSCVDGTSVALWAAATPQADRKWTLIGFTTGGKGFADFANPGAWGDTRGTLLPDDETRIADDHAAIKTWPYRAVRAMILTQEWHLMPPNCKAATLGKWTLHDAVMKVFHETAVSRL
eukprot:g22681.t1